MKVKDSSVDIWNLQLEMRPVLGYGAEVWESHGKELLITSGRDFIHSPWSYHHFGYAADFRTKFFDCMVAKQACKDLEAKLKAIDKRYRVILHRNDEKARLDTGRLYSHAHIEFRYDLPAV